MKKQNIKKSKALVIVLIMIILFVNSLLNISANEKRIYLIGDSIVCDYPKSKNPQKGWGQTLYREFKNKSNLQVRYPIEHKLYNEVIQYKLSNLMIENWAFCGASTKSFFNTDRLKYLGAKLKRGDFVFIQLGANDDRWWGCSLSDYERYLNLFIKQIKEKNAIPVLITPVPYCRFYNKKLPIYVPKHRNIMIKLSKKYKIPLLDLGKDTAEYFTSLGVKKTEKLYLILPKRKFKNFPNGSNDRTHFTYEGAKVLNRILLTEVDQDNRLKGISDKFCVHTRNLSKTMNKASKLVSSKKYTKKSRKYLQSVLKKSKKTLYNPSAKQKEINKCNSNIKKARKRLKKLKKQKRKK